MGHLTFFTILPVGMHMAVFTASIFLKMSLVTYLCHTHIQILISFQANDAGKNFFKKIQRIKKISKQACKIIAKIMLWKKNCAVLYTHIYKLLII